MLVKIEARILIFPGTDFHFPSTSVPPGTFFRLCQMTTFHDDDFCEARLPMLCSGCLELTTETVDNSDSLILGGAPSI